MPRSGSDLPLGMLWPAVLARTRAALASGALQPIETSERVVADAGVQFLVRMVSSLARKPRSAARAAKQPDNPFLPVDPALLVGTISPAHTALLNKYPVLEHHLLVVTRRFVPQEALLDAEDFAALAACMRQIDGLAFYNGGVIAGASQPHKHLQWVPLPLSPVAAGIPVEPLLEHATLQSAPAASGDLPFEHGFVRLDPAVFAQEDEAALLLARCYRTLLQRADIDAVDSVCGPLQSRPYNLLITRRWMLLVARRQECFDSISINALGFAGMLLVKNAAQMALLLERGPMAALREVAFPSA